MRRSYSPGVRQTYSTHKMDFLMEFENLIYGGLLEDVLPQNSGSELATPAEAGVCNSSNSLPTQYGNYCVEEGGVLSHRYPGCPKAEASFLKILCDKPVKETQARCTTQKNTTCRKCVLGWGGFFAYLILERAPALQLQTCRHAKLPLFSFFLFFFLAFSFYFFSLSTKYAKGTKGGIKCHINSVMFQSMSMDILGSFSEKLFLILYITQSMQRHFRKLAYFYFQRQYTESGVNLVEKCGVPVLINSC